jgi:hypothetical protein
MEGEMKKKAFVLIGHSNWGKTKTLFELKGKNRKVFYVKISNEWFLIRTRSNDDIYRELLIMIEEIVLREVEYIIFPLCPDFIDKNKVTLEILQAVAVKYETFFYVLEKKYGEEEYISQTEIETLKKFGKVKVLKGQFEAKYRSQEFKNYIEENL